jgi:branched-chain amino acid aminotransferase
VTECTGDNIFIIKNGKMYTPPSVCGQSGLLEGVTRRFVMEELSKACGVECHEKLMRLDEVLGADEVFLTGTAAEMIAVHSVGDFKISEGEGPITRKLRQKFRQIVTSDHIPED